MSKTADKDGLSKIVYVVDDDEAIRDAIGMFLEAQEIPCSLFSSADEFLASYTNDLSGCLILDIRMPGLSGIDMQIELGRINSILPIIFITGHGDLPMAVEAMRQGAFDFIRKPIDEEKLLTRIYEAIEHESETREKLRDYEQTKRKLKSLTQRQYQVFKRVSNGKSNKIIADELGISEKTVEVHRSSVMNKMNADSMAQLVRMYVDLEKSGYLREFPS